MKYKVLATDIEIICSIKELENGIEQLELEYFADVYDDHFPPIKIDKHKTKTSIYCFSKDERNPNDIAFIEETLSKKELLNKKFSITLLQ